MPAATFHAARAVTKRRSNVVRALVAIVLGVVSAELCVRLAMDPTLDWDSIFSPGPYCTDDDVGFTTLCPNTRGVMKIMGAKIYSTFQKNDRGVRGPLRTAPADPTERVQKVVLLGGQSQGFGYGLDEQDTFPAVAAAHACRPVEIQNFGLVGDSNFTTFYQFMKHVDAPGDHVILMFYWPSMSNAELPNLRLWGERIAILGGWHFAVPPWLPAAARKSQLIVRAFKRSGELVSFLGRIVASAHAEADKPKPIDSAATVDSIRDVERYAVSHGAKFTVLVLPGPPIDPLSDGFGRRLQDVLPDVDIVDFAAEFERSGEKKYPSPASYGPEGYFFIDGHFNKRMTDKIGRRIAQVLCDRN